MKIKFSYLDNDINFTEGFINTLEILNNRYFYRIVSDFYRSAHGEVMDYLNFFDENDKSINLSSKIKVITDYFNFDLDNKSYSTALLKVIKENIDDTELNKIISNYNRFAKSYLNSLTEINLPLKLTDDISIENIIKKTKLSIDIKDNLLDNLFLLIDLESNLHSHQILVFVNLKQYLTNSELKEFYKYSIYNKVKILLIDSQNYKNDVNSENKLIIYDNLEENMVKLS